MNNEKSKSLQGLRALGFILVFLWHCGYGNAGAYAVSLFIMLSGFLLMLKKNQEGIHNQSLLSNIKYSIRRIGKFYPLHIIFFIFAFLYLMITNQLEREQLVLKCISNIFLFQSLIPSSSYYYSFNGVSWYLSLTLILYILFPYIKKRIEKKDPTLFACMLFFFMIIYCGIVSIIPVSADIKKWLVYINPFFRCFDFSIGCCAGFIYKTERLDDKVLKISGFLFCLLSVCSIFLFGKLRENESYIWFVYSLIYTPAVFLGLLSISSSKGIISRVLSFKPCVWLGNISGYTFLIHQIVIWDVGLMLSKMGIVAPLRVIFSFTVTVFIAIAYDYMIKSHLLTTKKRISTN